MDGESWGDDVKKDGEEAEEDGLGWDEKAAGAGDGALPTLLYDLVVICLQGGMGKRRCTVISCEIGTSPATARHPPLCNRTLHNRQCNFMVLSFFGTANSNPTPLDLIRQSSRKLGTAKFETKMMFKSLALVGASLCVASVNASFYLWNGPSASNKAAELWIGKTPRFLYTFFLLYIMGVCGGWLRFLLRSVSTRGREG
jgi:hypothetical protein